MTEETANLSARYMRRHIRFGWAQLLVFLLLGMVLEAMHGFKVGWYLNAGEEVRRLLLTLAHAHGVLLGLVNIALGATLHAMPHVGAPALRMSSSLLLTASILMPLGFLLGGLVTYGGDPGPGIFMLAPAALLLAVAVARITFAVYQRSE